MSKQRTAPGELERVRRFVNTWQVGHGTDRLSDTEGVAEWFAAEGLAAGERARRCAELARAIELREALRAVLVAHNDAERAARRRTRAGHSTPPRVVPGCGCSSETTAARRSSPRRPASTGALGRLVAIVHDSIGHGTWARLKACRDHDCEWAFYDHTKNRSGAWCSMEGCGNRREGPRTPRAARRAGRVARAGSAITRRDDGLTPTRSGRDRAP